jgi:hypothetical protein
MNVDFEGAVTMAFEDTCGHGRLERVGECEQDEY